MKPPLAGLLFVAALLLQGTLMNHLTLFGMSPNLIFCLAVLFPFLYGGWQGWLFLALAGVLFDLGFSPVIGPTALACLAASVFVLLLKLFLDRDNLLSLLIASLAGAPVFYLLEWVLFTLTGASVGFFYALGRLPIFVVVNLLAILVYYAAIGRRAIRFTGDKRFRGSLPYYE